MTSSTVRCSMLPPQTNFIRKATAGQHTFISICADSIEVGMVIIMKNRVVLITGAAGGIGSACARCFYAAGDTVVLTDIKNEAGKMIADQLGERACYLPLDVRKEEQWIKIMEDIMNLYGRLDVLINAAGMTGLHKDCSPQNPEFISLEDWQKVHDVNLTGVFLGCKYGIQAMRKSGAGSIINISSRSGLVGVPAMSAYASSKAAVRNHTKSVALYCAKENLQITCNSLHPAYINTTMWSEIADAFVGNQDPKMKERYLRSQIKLSPMKRWGEASEVAEAILFLASDQAKYITGTELNIDGGVIAGGGSI